jgi:hypothetical protein
LINSSVRTGSNLKSECMSAESLLNPQDRLPFRYYDIPVQPFSRSSAELRLGFSSVVEFNFDMSHQEPFISEDFTWGLQPQMTNNNVVSLCQLRNIHYPRDRLVGMQNISGRRWDYSRAGYRDTTARAQSGASPLSQLRNECVIYNQVSIFFQQKTKKPRTFYSYV